MKQMLDLTIGLFGPTAKGWLMQLDADRLTIVPSWIGWAKEREWFWEKEKKSATTTYIRNKKKEKKTY